MYDVAGTSKWATLIGCAIVSIFINTETISMTSQEKALDSAEHQRGWYKNL